MTRVSYDLLKREFAEWLALPKGQRVPPSIKEWAEAHDMKRENVTVWQNLPEIRKRVAEVSSGVTSPDDMATIFNKLKAQAKAGHVPSIQALYEMAGVGIELSDDDVEAINAALIGKAKQGNVPAARLVAKRQKTDAPPQDTDMSKLSDAELEALACG